MIEAMLLTGGLAAPGEMIFATPGTYTVDVPLGVSRVSMVGVGAGADGSNNSGGGGGALVYVSNVDVANYSTLQVTVGTAGAASVVQGLLTAPGGDSFDGGALPSGRAGGKGGNGGGYLTGGGGHGGGGGAAGRYGTDGGDGSIGSLFTEVRYSFSWSFIRRVHEGESPMWSDYPHDIGYLREMPSAAQAEYYWSLAQPSDFIVVVRDSGVAGAGAYNFYVATRNESYIPHYQSNPPTGNSGQGRGGEPNQDGEGVDLFGSNTTPPNNGYGYGGGRNRPGGRGAVRIIWGEGRSFPNNAGQAESETVEVY